MGFLERLNVRMRVDPQNAEPPIISLVQLCDWGEINEAIAADGQNPVRHVPFDGATRGLCLIKKGRLL
ncbi:hypothetical protein [Rhizobium sp. R693]|uniref:hypothetical protein n=1 Tax=Rhizobium sp. R693 TaxID=1764276 RepID=UPI001AEF5083|nr:hypothetical protein [Rhizobium sp. R693]